MLRRVTPALLAWALLGATGALAQVPAPVAPPGTPGPIPGGPPGPPPSIPVRQAPVAVPGVPQASPAAIPANLPPPPPAPGAMPIPAALPGPPGAPGAPGAPNGLPGAVGAAINAVLAPPPPPPKREPKENEVELTRADYRQRLVVCLQFRPGCSVRGLSAADQDYMRYELKGQRLGGMLLDEVADARMTQFNNDITVIVPKRTGSPDWHADLARGKGATAEAGANYAMSNTETQRESGGNVRTRYVPWPKQNIQDRSGGARARQDLD